MKLREIAELLGSPGERFHRSDALSRCYSIDDLARRARRRLPAAAYDYLEGGGEDECTLRRNRSALEAIEVTPNVLRDVREVDLAIALFGARLPSPNILAPVGGPRLFHHDGELAVARAAATAGVPYVVSTLSSVSLEDIARAATSPLWFQLYVWGDRGISRNLIQRAQQAGYEALVVTVDCSVRSKREREMRAGVTLPTPRLTARSIVEGARHPAWAWHFLSGERLAFPNLDVGGNSRGSMQELGRLFDGSLTWDDLDWIRHSWRGPLVLKGLLSADDARRAVDLGVEAIVVSNHGGRQLDHVPAAIDALPAVVDAVGDRAEVLFDSGVRRGSDVLAAVSLGASAVLVGRAYLYGLAAAGYAGVERAIEILDEELRIAMALSGTTRLTRGSPVVGSRPSVASE